MLAHTVARLFLSLVFVLSFLSVSPSYAASFLTVNSLLDDPDLPDLAGNGTCDLREAIQAANTDSIVGECDGSSGADVIQFNTSYPASLTLTAPLPVISANLTVDGPGAYNLTLHGADEYRLFSIQSAAQVTLEGLTLAHGKAPTTGTDDRKGGAIYNLGNLILENMKILDSAGINYGGGVYNVGILELKGTTIAGCAVGTNGGAIYNALNAEVTIDTSSQIGLPGQPNTANNQGAGIYNEGLAEIHGTVADNSCGDLGGGIYNYKGNLKLLGAKVRDNFSPIGGGLYLNQGNIEIEDSLIQHNTTTYSGAGLEIINATLVMTRTVVTGNIADGYGGGMKLQDGSLTIRQSLVSENIAKGGSGAGITLINSGSLLLENSTVFGNINQASDGGGITIFSGCSAIINQSTISGNTSTNYGGGIFSRGTVTISSSTITDNTADADNGGGGEGGGIARYEGDLSISHSLIGNNLDLSGGTPDCYNRSNSSSFVSNGYNLVENGCFSTQASDIIGLDPMVGALINNGGPLLPGGFIMGTHALAKGSPARNAGDPSFVSPPEFDQRGTGFPRLLLGRIDIGALESGYDLYLPMTMH
jgi:predicted outer membrane repeat protein